MNRTPRVLLLVLLLSVVLNAWGIGWGLPERWHPDEITQRAENMAGALTINPHYFAYGSFHYYPVIGLAVLPVKIPNQIVHKLGFSERKYMFFDYSAQETVVVILSRLISVLLGAGTVLLVFHIARELFAQKAAVLSALFLAVSMGFVNISHFATVDIPSLFWFTLSGLMSVRVYTSGRLRWYLLAGLFAGLAAAVKYVGGVSAISLVAAHVLREQRRHKALFLGTACAAAGFTMGNPIILFSPFEFAEGFLRESAFNSARGAGDPTAFIPLLGELANALGVPLFVLSMCGLAYGVYLLRDRANRGRLLMIFSMLFPYYVVMGSMNVSVLRYTVPMIPFLAILAGKLAADSTSLRSHLARGISGAVVVLVVGYSIAYSAAADLEFTRDSRYLARQWLETAVPEGSIVEVTSYGPDIPEQRYEVVQRPHHSNVDQTAALLQEKARYRTLLRLIGKMKALTNQVRIRTGKERYVPWYEREMGHYQRRAESFDVSLEGLTARSPDYLIVSDFYYKRFTGEHSGAEGELFEALLTGRTNYVETVEFKYSLSPWIDPRVEFVNPKLVVFARKEEGS